MFKVSPDSADDYSPDAPDYVPPDPTDNDSPDPPYLSAAGGFSFLEIHFLSRGFLVITGKTDRANTNELPLRRP